MKVKKNLFFVAIMLASLMFSGCEMESTDIYHYDIETVTASDAALMVVYDYLNEVGCYTGTKAFFGTTNENDNQAKDLFDENAGKIKRSELQVRLNAEQAKWYEKTVKFSYVLWRGKSSSTAVIIDTKEYSFTISNN
ncbi:MAG: hypothetical protein LBN95_10985 [Prevotellaceae bacterium]|jgi:hypothetical protein|nr:hypothetical protein [Prevotellaceae bacterium]